MLIEGFLREINVKEETIREIVAILDQNAAELHGGQLESVPVSALGGSPAGATLGHHTSVAHQHFVDAMDQMATGLRAYIANVERFHDDMNLTDEASGQGQAKIASKVMSVQDATGCAAAPDLTTNTNCSAPGSDD